jgi:hypothetical protein
MKPYLAWTTIAESGYCPFLKPVEAHQLEMADEVAHPDTK